MPRSATSTSPAWDPRTALNLYTHAQRAFNCVGETLDGKCCTKAIDLERRRTAIEILDGLENTTPAFSNYQRRKLKDLAGQLLCYLHEDQIEEVAEAWYNCLLPDEEIEDFAEVMRNISLGPPAISEASPTWSLGSRVVLKPIGPSKRLCSKATQELAPDLSKPKERDVRIKANPTGRGGRLISETIETRDRRLSCKIKRESEQQPIQQDDVSEQEEWDKVAPEFEDVDETLVEVKVDHRGARIKKQ